MRLFFLFVLVAARLSWAASCSNTSLGSGWTCNQSTSANGTGGATTFTLAYTANVTAGSFLFADARVGSTSTTATFSDGSNGSWNPLDNAAVATNKLFTGWVHNTASGVTPTVTVTMNGASTSVRLEIFEYTGQASSSELDVHNAQVQNSIGTTMSAPAVTTTVNNDLVLSGAACNTGSGVFSAGTSFTLRELQDASVTLSKLGSEDRLLATAGAITATIGDTTGATDSCAVYVAAFKPTSGASAPHGQFPRIY
jgi:hypothetical protein